MSWRGWTGAVIVAATLGLILWDVFVVIVAGSPATISNLLLTTGTHHPAIPLFLGGLMGHLFWTGRTLGPGWLRVALGAVLLLATVACGVFLDLRIPPFLPLASGVLLGRALVPQRTPTTKS
jgi:hypothetical protein